MLKLPTDYRFRVSWTGKLILQRLIVSVDRRQWVDVNAEYMLGALNGGTTDQEQSKQKEQSDG